MVWNSSVKFIGTGLNCTKTKLHEVTKLHQAKFAWGKKLHEDDFALTVNFAQVTFLHESEKIQKKLRIKEKTDKIK